MLKILKRKSVIALADQGVFSGTNFVVTILLAHAMTPRDFGTLAGITLVTYLLIGATNALVIQPFQVLVARAGDRKRYLDFNIQAQLALVTILTIGVVVVSSILSADILSAAVGFAYFLLIYDTFRKILLAQDEPHRALILDLLVALVQFTGIGLVLAIQVDLDGALRVLAISYLAGIAGGWWMLRPSLQISKDSWMEWLGAHASQGKWLLITSAVQWAAANLFVMMAGVYLGPASLGAFRVVQSLFGIVNLGLQSYENYMVPKAVRLMHESTETARRYLLKIGVQGLAFFGSVLVVLFLFPGAVMNLAGGAQYSDYGFVVRGMVILYAIILIGYPVRMSIRVLVMNREFFAGYLVSFIFSALTSWFLLRMFGLSGAIAGLIVNQLLLVVIWQYYLSKRNFILWKSSM